MSTKRRKPVLSVIVVILLLLVIVVALITNLTFTMSSSPHFFGRYITLIDKADDTMEPQIPAGTAVVSNAASSNTKVENGTLVLCMLKDGTMAVRAVSSISKKDDGSATFVPVTLKGSKQGDEISTGNILAVCAYKSNELSSFIGFARSFYGVAVLLILPCVILVIMLVVAISRASKAEYEEETYEPSRRKSDMTFDDDEENYVDDGFEDDEYYEDDDYDSPLYTPSGAGSDDLDRKKSAIADNFQRKRVDSSSPYQQAVARERTMQFKVHRGNEDSEDAAGLYPRKAATAAGFTQKITRPGEYSHSDLEQFPSVKDIKVSDYNSKPNYGENPDRRYVGEHEKVSNYDVEEEDFIDDDFDGDETRKEYRPEDYEDYDMNYDRNYISKHEAKNSDEVHRRYDSTSKPKHEEPEKSTKKPELEDILDETKKDNDEYIRPEQKDIQSVDELIEIIKKEKENDNKKD